VPLTHLRAFRVRHYECGPDGLVQAANYLRYMQEAAFDASAAAGYDMARYEAMGCHWLIRETEVEYHAPLRYGQTVEVRTWVADFRRVRSRRAYEFRLPADGTRSPGALVARAHTDWVFLDTETLRPATIPGEMRVAFFPEGPPVTAPPRDRFPDVSPPAGAFHQRRQVERRDLDPAGHVNNCVYLDYVQECGRLWAATEGREPAGVPLPRQCRIEYRLPALLDEELELVTWLEDDGALPTRYTFIYRPADGALLARARSIEE
jgi:acyl-CoA thioester hydrolase